MSDSRLQCGLPQVRTCQCIRYHPEILPVVYRSVAPGSTTQVKRVRSVRMPRNVPYLVDNLWEWARPSGYPCRRSAVHASPTIKLARALGPEGGVAYRVELDHSMRIAQLRNYEDSKSHPECTSLRKWVLSRLGKAWLRLPVAQKLASGGQLFLPGLSAQDVQAVIDMTPALRERETQLRSQIHYWDDSTLVNGTRGGLPSRTGEVFFEAPYGHTLMPSGYLSRISARWARLASRFIRTKKRSVGSTQIIIKWGD